MRGMTDIFDRFVAHAGDQIFLWRNRRTGRPGSLGFAAYLGAGGWRSIKAVDWRRAAMLGLDRPRGKWATAIALASVAAITFSIVRLGTATASDTRHIPSAYFYNLDTGHVQAAPLAQAPTQRTIDGTSLVVRAHVYSCSTCDNAAQREVRYVERMSAEAQAISVRGPQNEAEAELMRSSVDLAVIVDGKTDRWYPLHSAEGKAIIREARAGCEKSHPLECIP